MVDILRHDYKTEIHYKNLPGHGELNTELLDRFSYSAENTDQSYTTPHYCTYLPDFTRHSELSYPVFGQANTSHVK